MIWHLRRPETTDVAIVQIAFDGLTQTCRAAGHVHITAWSVFTKGVRGMKTEYLAKGKTADGKPKAETTDEKKRRRIMAYAIPVCVATWIVMAWKLPTLDRTTQAPASPAQAQTQPVEAA